MQRGNEISLHKNERNRECFELCDVKIAAERKRRITRYGSKRIFRVLESILHYKNTCTALTDIDTLTNRARHTDLLCKRRI